MPFLLLLCFMLACLPVHWPVPALGSGPLAGIAQTVAVVALLVGSAALLARRTIRQLAYHPEECEDIAHRFGGRRTLHLFAILAGFGACLYVLGWGWTVQTLCRRPGRADLADGTPALYPGSELLILLPLVLTLVLSWACFYDAERAFHRSFRPAAAAGLFWGRWAYVGFLLKQNLALVLLPILLFVAAEGVRREWPSLLDDRWGRALMLGPMLGLLVVMPWLLRWLLGLRPLPPGPLRTRLEATARRLNCRITEILLWNTRSGVANAMVIGLAPFLRYVLLTDRLIAELSADEVEAVFGHEIGHVKHQHVATYIGFLFLSLTALGASAKVLDEDPFRTWLPAGFWPGSESESWQVLPMVLVLGGYIFVVFGFLSRRCERQADIYGCRAVSCGRCAGEGHGESVQLSPGGQALCPTGIHTFIRALEKVAYLNGMSRRRPGWLQSWQHSTIAQRVEFLQRMLADERLERRFQRSVRVVKWTLLIGLATVLIALGGRWGWEVLAPF